jgi:hypothetical protein
MRFLLTAYFENAMSDASYVKLEDGTFVGTIASPNYVRPLEDWVLVGLKLGPRLPLSAGSLSTASPEF